MHILLVLIIILVCVTAFVLLFGGGLVSVEENHMTVDVIIPVAKVKHYQER